MLIGGDFRFFWPENIGDFATIPMSWDSSLNTGLGISALNSLWITSYFNFTAFFSKLGLSWEAISLLFWILPAILISFLSSFLLFSYLFSRETGSRFAEKDKIKYSFLSGIIYTLNTYFLMVLTGGQLGIALSYSLVPLVFLGFVRVIRDCRLRDSIIAGVIVALQILFDPRLTFITLLAVGLYWFFIRKNIIFVFLIPSLLAALLHSYWVLPLFLTKISPIPADFDSLAGFEFFSFADFPHALSFLHPNWPENIFGKVYFMKAEFILLPILAYASLLFISVKRKAQSAKLQLKAQNLNNNLTIEQFNNRTIVFFALLGLLGAFLAKGANEPFSAVNIWLFENIPGFAMFRDPTKFYILIALAYSFLIPFSVYSVYKWISAKCKVQSAKSQFKVESYIPKLFILFTISYLLFLIRPVVFGQLSGTFKAHETPRDYIALKDFLYNQSEFFRTLWIPQWQRFGYFSNKHPAIGREEILKGDAEKQVNELKKESFEKMLNDLSIKYIIVPYDSEGEIFLRDRRYDNNQYLKTIGELKQIKWLKQVNCSIVKLLNCYGSDPFGKIAVFEIPNSKDHFWSPQENLSVRYQYVNPTKYILNVQNAKKDDILVFSEVFDEKWFVENSEFPAKPRQTRRMQDLALRDKVQSSKFGNILNSFILPKDGSLEFKVFYGPQRYVEAGLWLSGLTFLGSVGYLIFGKKAKK